MVVPSSDHFYKPRSVRMQYPYGIQPITLKTIEGATVTLFGVNTVAVTTMMPQ